MRNNLQNPRKVQVEVETEQQRPQPPHDEGTRFTCEICIEPTLADRKFRNSSLCVHPFCVDCIAKYIEVKLDDGSTGKIKCPGLNCEHLLAPLSCRPIMSQANFVKWCDLLCNSAVPRLHKRYCPYQNCSVLVLDECKAKLKKVQCPNCKRYFCLTCMIPWQLDIRAGKTDSRDRNDVLVGQLIELHCWTRYYACGLSVLSITCSCQENALLHLNSCVYRNGGSDGRRCGVWFCHRLRRTDTPGAVQAQMVWRVVLLLPCTGDYCSHVIHNR